MICLITLIISSMICSFDYQTRSAMDQIYIIELAKRNVAPNSTEFQILTLVKHLRIGLLPNTSVNNIYPSAQDFMHYACDKWSDERIQLQLLLENRYYIDHYRLFLTLLNTHR